VHGLKRLVIAGLVPAVLFLGCVSPAQDPGEIASQADRAAKQFDAVWSPKKKSLEESRDAQQDIQAELSGIAPDTAARTEELCSDDLRMPAETALFAQINSIFDELMSGVLNGLDAHQASSRKFAQAGSADEATKRALYRELVWSRARLDMARTLLTTFRIDAEVQVLRMQNACLVRLIFRSKPAGGNDAELGDLQERLEEETERAASSFGPAYRDALSQIASTQAR
jgi:hypothetical protein